MQDSIDDYLFFLKKRIDYHSRKSRNLASINPRASALHEQTASNHTQIVNWFVEFQKDPPLNRKKIDDLFSIDVLDIDNLDEDIRQELNLTDSDVSDAQIIELLDIAGRPLDLNQIIIGSSRKYDVKHKRNQLTARIHRLVTKGQVKVAGKGLYKLSSKAEEPEIIMETVDDLIDI